MKKSVLKVNKNAIANYYLAGSDDGQGSGSTTKALGYLLRLFTLGIRLNAQVK